MCRWRVILLLGAGAAWLPAKAQAQEPPAAEHDPREAEARASCLSGDVTAGIALLARMYADSGDPRYVYNQARCFQQNGRAEEAILRFQEYLRVDRQATPEERAEAEAHIAEIRREQVSRDRPPPPGQAPVERTDDSGRSRWRTAAWVLGGAGLVGIGTGAFFSLRVRSLEQEAENQARQHMTVDPGAQERGRRAETWQWISYGAGVLALGGAALALLLPPSGPQESAVALRPDGAGLRFTF